MIQPNNTGKNEQDSAVHPHTAAITAQPETAAAAEAFAALFTTIKRLRAPGGCPWDIEQTPMTLRSTLLEETYETIEALEEASADSAKAVHAAEELGDVLLNIVMIAYMFEQEGAFSVAKMIDELNEKLIRRQAFLTPTMQKSRLQRKKCSHSGILSKIP